MFLFRLLIVAVILVAMAPAASLAVGSLPVISELQTGSASSASQEFVELYNPTASAILVDNWKLQYQSSNPSDPNTWATKATLSGSIPAHGFFLVAPRTYLPQADASLSTGLAGTGGHIRLIDQTGNQIDLLGWGSASRPETLTAPAPAAGQSLERLPGRLVEDGGNATDTNDNSQDFILRADPQPQHNASLSETPFSGTLPADDETDSDAPPPVDYAALQISELLPDPVSPQTDARDEFIEIFNPTTKTADLKGYSLQVGRKYYVFNEQTIIGSGYLSVYSAVTKLALTNAGTTVTLMDPAGNILDEVSYDEAQAGAAWAKVNNAWDWTASPTPNLANASQPLVVSNKSKSAAKPAAAKKIAAGKTKTAQAKSVPPKAEEALQAAAQTIDSPAARWLLIGLAGFTIIYALYEYRYDIRNYIKLARRYFQSRREARQIAGGRGDN